MVGAIRSERWAASDRNRWAAYVRIRNNPEKQLDWGSWYRRIQPADVHGEALLGDGKPLLLLDHSRCSWPSLDFASKAPISFINGSGAGRSPPAFRRSGDDMPLRTGLGW